MSKDSIYIDRTMVQYEHFIEKQVRYTSKQPLPPPLPGQKYIYKGKQELEKKINKRQEREKKYIQKRVNSTYSLQ
jgi:hypothetical protein